MDTSKQAQQSYDAMVKKASPNSPILSNCIKAFVSGGLICVLGQALLMLYTKKGISEADAALWVSITLIGISAVLTAFGLYEKLGFRVIPNGTEPRHDIIQAVELGSAEAMEAFCQGIQAAAPVDSYVTPIPYAMPGYNCDVIMAAGAFIQGSSIELSADGPIRAPYSVYFQGGLTWEHAKYGIMMSLQKIYETGKLKNILINDTES